MNTESTIQESQSLAAVIRELAGKDQVQTIVGTNGVYTFDNAFWVALFQKADQSAEYIADTRNAERLY